MSFLKVRPQIPTIAVMVTADKTNGLAFKLLENKAIDIAKQCYP